MTDLVERPRFHVMGQTTPGHVGPRWYIWDGVEGHFARFQNIADAGDAQAICEMLNEQSDAITRLRAALPIFERVIRLAHTLASDVPITASARQHIDAAYAELSALRSSVGGE